MADLIQKEVNSSLKASETQLPVSQITTNTTDKKSRKRSSKDISVTPSNKTKSGEAACGSNVNKQTADVSEPTMSDIMKILRDNQAEQNAKISDIMTKVDDLYYADCDDNILNESGPPPGPGESVVNTQYDFDYDEDTVIDDDCQSQPPHKKSKVDGDQLSVFTTMKQKYKITEKLDKNANEGLADMVNSVFSTGMADEHFSRMIKDIHRPENCDFLVLTRVNPLIWNRLSPDTQTRDVKLQAIQNCVIKAACVLTKLADTLHTHVTQSDVPEIMLEQASDALALLGQSNRMFNLRRKEIHKPDVVSDYAHLTSPALPYSSWLYGDNVSQIVKDIQDVNRIGKRISRGPAFPRQRGGYNFSHRGRGARHTRGRGRGKYNNSYNSNWSRWRTNSNQEKPDSSGSKNSKGELSKK